MGKADGDGGAWWGRWQDGEGNGETMAMVTERANGKGEGKGIQWASTSHGRKGERG